MKITRKYYRLEEAAKLLSASPDDLVHLAAHGEIRLHVLLPANARVTPIWYLEDDPFGENLCHVMGYEADEPVELLPRDWKSYEADNEGSKISYLSDQNFKESEFQNVRKGIIFGGWSLLNLAWDRCEFPISECSIVLIQSELQQIGDHAKDSPKPLSTTERNTLLTIIAALCDYSAIKHQERGAALAIMRMTDEIAAHVDDGTIRTALAKIPDALETRMK